MCWKDELSDAARSVSGAAEKTGIKRRTPSRIGKNGTSIILYWEGQQRIVKSARMPKKKGCQGSLFQLEHVLLTWRRKIDGGAV